MSGDAYGDAIAIGAAGYASFGAAKDESILAQRAGLESKQALIADEAERAKLIAENDEDEALRHLDGEAAVPLNPRREKRIAALSKSIARRKSARPILDQRIAEAARRAEAARVPFTAAAIQAVLMIQQPAAEQVRVLLAELEQPLRDLLVADRILAGTIGERFPVPTGSVPPFNGATLVRKLLRGIAPRLLPPALNEVRLDAAATAVAVSAIRNIKKG